MTTRSMFISHRDSKCDEYSRVESGPGITTVEKESALYLACADLDELVLKMCWMNGYITE